MAFPMSPPIGNSYHREKTIGRVHEVLNLAAELPAVMDQMGDAITVISQMVSTVAGEATELASTVMSVTAEPLEKAFGVFEGGLAVLMAALADVQEVVTQLDSVLPIRDTLEGLVTHVTSVLSLDTISDLQVAVASVIELVGGRRRRTHAVGSAVQLVGGPDRPANMVSSLAGSIQLVGGRGRRADAVGS